MTAKISRTMFLDDEIAADVDIIYDYNREGDRFYDYRIIVYGMDYTFKNRPEGDTTPEDIIIGEVKDFIKSNHAGIRVEFEL